MNDIVMVDLKGQYQRIKPQIDSAIQQVLDSTSFIKGPSVKSFEDSLADYLGCKAVVGCGNGTDALQIAMMALDLKAGDEVLVPAFTYVATAEVIALLGLKPVFVDVNPHTFCIDVQSMEERMTKNAKAVVPVHLFGQSADMGALLDLAKENSLKVIEDNAQALGASYQLASGAKKCGTLGEIGTTSFFPSKNLGCFGDGGALTTENEELAERCRMIANHGQSKKYYHDAIGINSRLDTLQAAILAVKLQYLDDYAQARQKVADIYDQELGSIDFLEIPLRDKHSSHVFHQYTLKISGNRASFIAHLKEAKVPSMIYYPLPLHHQKAYYSPEVSLPVAESLSNSVVSLPIHTEMDEVTQEYIIETIKKYEPK